MRQLDAREYKLLLNPAKFGNLLTKAHANEFWDGEIAPIIDRRWGGSLCVSNTFDKLIERVLCFWDTRDCALTAAEFILRSRVDASDGTADSGRQEIALKLRMADLFVRVIAAHVNDVRTPERETVTLLNTADVPIDLAGWQIKDKQKNAMSLSGSISAGATQVVEIKAPVARAGSSRF
ncbi:lamin tail domain-containing protein [Rhizobium laguerreae]|uniref:lamin tail domain-containing protein n=1 Tax=Rhizobium laguerreae TaxID=1076926 RepID=UPI001FE26FA2|nr:lamin tail domain-containing protein [Rhizobium laguerreae]